MTEVVNLNNGDVVIYSCKPEEAVIAAHAQSLGDWNTWDYDERYGEKVERGDFYISCGDFTALL